MENVHITYNEFFGYVLAINVLLGFLFGFFPLLAGIKMHNRKYGVFGLAASVFGGAIAGVLISFPAAAIFFWLIVREVPRPAAPGQVEPVPEDN